MVAYLRKLQEGRSTAYCLESSVLSPPAKLSAHLAGGVHELLHLALHGLDVHLVQQLAFLKLAGVVQAQSNYGLALMQGKGVPRDEKAAVDWFVRAADQGDPDVQNWLGLCYQDGRCGVLIDDAEVDLR